MTKQNDIQQNDIQQNDIQQNDIQQNYIQKKEQAKMDRDCTEKTVRNIVAIWFVGVKIFLLHL